MGSRAGGVALLHTRGLQALIVPSSKSTQCTVEHGFPTVGPADKAAIYQEMGITLTYHQDARVLVESRPRVVDDGDGGARTISPQGSPAGVYSVAV